MVRWYEQTNDMFVLASVLIESLIQNHPFANAQQTNSYDGWLRLLVVEWL